MRWWWRKRPPPPPAEDGRDAAAEDAIEDAVRRLRVARADTARAGAQGRYWRRQREKNHFAELIIDIVRSVRP